MSDDNKKFVQSYNMLKNNPYYANLNKAYLEGKNSTDLR